MMEMWSLISHLPAYKVILFIFFLKAMKGVAQLTIMLSSWPQLFQADDIHYIKTKIRSLSRVLSCQESLACETGQGLEDSHLRIFKACKCFQAILNMFGSWDWYQSFSQRISKVKTGLSFMHLCEWTILLSRLLDCLLMVYFLLDNNTWFRKRVVKNKTPSS